MTDTAVSTTRYEKRYECTQCVDDEGNPFVWYDTWDCLCDDKCPRCNVAHEVVEWTELEGESA